MEGGGRRWKESGRSRKGDGRTVHESEETRPARATWPEWLSAMLWRRVTPPGSSAPAATGRAGPADLLQAGPVLGMGLLCLPDSIPEEDRKAKGDVFSHKGSRNALQRRCLSPRGGRGKHEAKAESYRPFEFGRQSARSGGGGWPRRTLLRQAVLWTQATQQATGGRERSVSGEQMIILRWRRTQPTMLIRKEVPHRP